MVEEERRKRSTLKSNDKANDEIGTDRIVIMCIDRLKNIKM